MEADWIEAKFISEEKNRFICTISIDGQLAECYIPSSSKLNNFIKLSGEKIWVSKNKGKKTRTKYKLQAAKVGDKMLYLNLNGYNDLLVEYLFLTDVNIKEALVREVKISPYYRADILLQDNNKQTICEVKAIVTEDNTTVYPVGISSRAVRQLDFFRESIEQYEINYCIIVPEHVREIQLNREEISFIEAFNVCVDLGMEVRFYSINWYEKHFSIKESKFRYYPNEMVFRKAE